MCCLILFWDGFFDSASVLTKSVAEVTFRLAYILNVTFVTLYYMNEIGRRASDVMSYASLIIGREKRVRRGSLSNGKEASCTYFCDNGKLQKPKGGRGFGLPAVFLPDQYVTKVFATAVRYTRRRRKWF